MSDQTIESPLDIYRILDLTEKGCMIGGKMLGDLGADVIKIEPPGGSPSRSIGPFYKDTPDKQKSLFWFAYNNSKRGITLDITKNDGKELFKELLKTTDIVIENFSVGYMDSLGLGYSDLCQTKPDIIFTSITPYGQTGPKAHYKGSDLTGWASGGELYPSGDPDRAPTWISFPQALLHGGAEGAAASMIALWHKIMTGEGQHVDVSIQQAVLWTTMDIIGHYDCHNNIMKRNSLTKMNRGGVDMQAVFPTKDGFINALIIGGAAAYQISRLDNVMKWMEDDGMLPDWFRTFDWVKDYDVMGMAGLGNIEDAQNLANRVSDEFSKWFATKTKQEVLEEAVKRHVMYAPICNAKDIVEEQHHHDRGFWVQVDHPDLNDTLTYCGPAPLVSDPIFGIRRRAPLIGEHNEDIYENELKINKENITILKQAGVI